MGVGFAQEKSKEEEIKKFMTVEKPGLLTLSLTKILPRYSQYSCWFGSCCLPLWAHPPLFLIEIELRQGERVGATQLDLAPDQFSEQHVGL